MAASIVILLLLPLLNPMPSSSFAVVFRKPMFFLVGNLMILGLLGLVKCYSIDIHVTFLVSVAK